MDATWDAPLKERLYEAPASGLGPLISGIMLALCGAAVVGFSIATEDALRFDRELLFGIGTLMALAAVQVMSLALRPRRHWVLSDERGLSLPWAFGKPHVDWRDISNVRILSSGGLSVAGLRGKSRLRIAPELNEYDELLDQICDQLNANRGAPTQGRWKNRSGNELVELGPYTLDLRTARGAFALELREIRDAFIDVDERLRPTMVLTMRSGERVRLPNLGNLQTLELYRALRLRPR
jgi:hypothetical protein